MVVERMVRLGRSKNLNSIFREMGEEMPNIGILLLKTQFFPSMFFCGEATKKTSIDGLKWRDLVMGRWWLVNFKVSAVSGRPGSKFCPGRDRAGMTLIPAGTGTGTGIDMKSRPGPGLASSRPGPGPGPGFFH